MAKFVLRRLAFLPLVLFGVSLILFGLFHRLSPEMRAALYIKDPRQLNDLESVILKYGLKDPFAVQYGRWLKRVATGDLGYSETAKMPVGEAIGAFFPATIELSVLSFIPILLLGVWLGTMSAVNKDRWLDHLSRFVSITGYSLPSFVLGLLLLMVFYGIFPLFPPGRYSLGSDMIIHDPGSFTSYTGLILLDSLLSLQWRVFFDALKHLILPATTLTFITMALLVRVTRSSMLEELGRDYVRTARAKGLPEPVVIGHARKNAWIPVITVASILFVGLLRGVIITETVFAYPGIGRWVAQAALQLDIPGVLGVALLTSTLFVLGNLTADMLYALVDPRIRYK